MQYGGSATINTMGASWTVTKRSPTYSTSSRWMAGTLMVATIVVGLVVGAPAAMASTDDWIGGKWRFTATPQNYDARPGKFVWKITPRCEFPPCHADAYSFSTDRRWVLRWDPEGIYHVRKGPSTGQGKCYSTDTGRVLARKAWFVSVDISLWVSSSVGGRARWMRGSRTTTWEPTGSCYAAGCRRIVEFDQLSAKRNRP